MMFEDEILEDLDNEEEREQQAAAAAQEAGGEISETAAMMQDEAEKMQEAAAEAAEGAAEETPQPAPQVYIPRRTEPAQETYGAQPTEAPQQTYSTQQAEAPQQTYNAQQEEAPQQTYTERRASQLQIPAEPQKASGRNSIFKKAVAIALAGVLFGCAAGGTMAGVNALTNRSASVKEETVSAIGQAESTAEESHEAVIPTAAVAEAGASTGNDVSGIVEEAMPSVVAINSKMVITQNDFFFGPQKYEASGSGSGIIVGENDAELLLATNNHVVADSEDLQVTFVDGSTASAQVKGTDPDMDLAVVSVKLADIGADTRKAIKVASLGDSNALKLGEGVVAIGNALGEGQSVTVGYVSALNKEVPIEGSTRKLIQVDAAINPGNSGGALLNMRGELIGINSAKLASTEIEGIGYAIPISEAKDIMNNLMTRETRDQVPENEQGYIGIQLQNIDSTMAKAYGMPEGIYVFKIVEGGAASRSDLRERDIITKFDGQTVKTGEELQKMLTYYRGGETVTLTVQSLEGGKYVERQVEVTLGLREETRNMSQSSTEQG
jgi:serine protease Do